MRAELYLVVFTLLLGSTYSRSEEDSLQIFEHRGRDGVTKEWRLSSASILKSAKWDPSKSEPPISVSNAVMIAHNWITNHKENVIWHLGLRVDSVTSNSLHSDEPFAEGVFYYVVIFRNGEFDSTACIVLMNGSVLEPRRKVSDGKGPAVNSGQSP